MEDKLQLLINLDLENSIIGGILKYPELMEKCLVKSEYFYYTNNKTIMQVIEDIYKKGIKPDLMAVINKAIEKQVLDNAGGYKYIQELTQAEFSANTFEQTQRLLLEKYQKREAYMLMQKNMELLIDSDFGNFNDKMINDLADISDRTSLDSEDGSVKEALQNVFESMQVSNTGIKGASSGFETLDKYINGLQRKKLIVIGARPAMGKSATVTNIAEAHSIKNDKPTVIFSLEMSTEEMVERMISSVGNVNSELMRNPVQMFNDKHWERATQSIGAIGSSKIHIFDKPAVDMAYIKQKCRLVQRKYPGEHMVVFIDYLQLIKGDPRLEANKNIQIGEISKALKTMSKELDCTVIALSQLSRNVEQRQDKRPMQSDLRDSGQVEQDADIIGMLYRDEIYNPNTTDKDIMELIIVKNRGGRIGTINLKFHKEISKIVDFKQ